MPEGLWHKCPSCAEVVHNIALAENQRVCPRCDYHFAQSARDRILSLLDPESFHEHDSQMRSVDPLSFKGASTYTDRLRAHEKKTGLKDAVVSGAGLIESQEIAIALMDFDFMGASMGSVSGEKLLRIIEFATERKLPLLIISASGGARMYEGIFSLMQMSKTCGALALHAKANLPYISVLTHPTFGGVSASFATVGDIIIAEPKAMVGFAGPRVVRETTHQDLPPGFQTSEFLEEHGLVDLIVHRARLRSVLAELLRYLVRRP